MALAIFDLDNTLIAGDSGYCWGKFLIAQGVVDAEEFRAASARFDRQYLDGELDIYEYCEFVLRPLTQHPLERLHAWREQYVAREIEPRILPAARQLVAAHQARGDVAIIITATNRFLTAPIAELFGVEHLLACEPELIENRYTGRIVGIPTYREGKIAALEQWLEESRHSLEGSWFYSDSHNDIPLLERVDNPVAVDPDETLRHHAKARGWKIISLRDACPEALL